MLKRRIALLAAVLAVPAAVLAETADQLVRDYTRFAGSEANAESLVNGLRNDREITLTGDGGATTFAPRTGRMGNGNVDIALQLAEQSLVEQGIRSPTPEEIRAALNGGAITTKTGERIRLEGVLAMRASGMGWGRIAQEHGFKLGEVMRPDFHRAKLERPGPHGIERPERPHRIERPERPERHHRR